MKYLKLFEAFESEILSKTLSFLSKTGSEKLIILLTNLTKSADMPLSKLSDEQFQYLPFDKALQLNAAYTDEPCDAVSDRVFSGDDVLSGETCQGGRIKRKWGRRTRIVTCPKCSGTGTKPRNNDEVKWIKFWFDKDGNFVNTTAVDGIIRKLSNKKIVDPKTNKVYVERKVFNNWNKLETSTGDKIYIRLNYSSDFLIGTIFRKGADSIFIIQDECDGERYQRYPESPGEPKADWKKFGEYGWKISTSSDYIGDGGWILSEDTGEVDYKPNPYEWNALASIRKSVGDSVECINSNTEEKIKNASFALVLDWEGIRKGKYEKKSGIVKGREESKSGALALMSDEQIKDTNIKRYLVEIAKGLAVDENLKNVKRGAIKILGSSYAGFYILKVGLGNLSDFIDSIYRVTKERDAEDVEYYLRSANNKIQKELSNKNETNQRIKKETNIIIDKLKSFGDEHQILLRIFESFQVYLDLVYSYLKNSKIETIRNLEVVDQKLRSINNMYRNNNSTSGLRLVMNNYTNYITSSYDSEIIVRWLRNHSESQFEEAEFEMNEFIEAIKELL